MSEAQKTFNAGITIKESLLSAIKTTTEFISVVREKKHLKERREECTLKIKKIEKEIESLKVTLKIVTKELWPLKMNFKSLSKEEIKNALEEIISLKEEQLEKEHNFYKEIENQLALYSAEIEEYEIYIERVYEFCKDLISNKDIDFKDLSEEEFISFIIIITNLGERTLPNFNKSDMPEKLHNIVDITNSNRWSLFWEIVENN